MLREPTLRAGSYAQAAANAVVSNVATQGIAVATGLQKKFDWKSVAVSAVAAPLAKGIGELGIGNAVAGTVGGASTAFGGFVSNFTNRLVTGVVTQYVQKQIYHSGKMNYAQVAADAFGNAVADSIVRETVLSSSDSEAVLRKANAEQAEKYKTLARAGDWENANKLADSVMGRSVTLQAPAAVVSVYGREDLNPDYEWGPEGMPERAAAVAQAGAQAGEDARAERAADGRKIADTLAVANKNMDAFDNRVRDTVDGLTAIEAALKNPEQLALLKTNGFDPERLGKLREAYKADLISDDVYFNNKYDPNDESTAVEALKPSRMKEVLGQFGVTRMTQADVDARNIKLNISSWDDNGPGKSGYFGALYRDEKLDTYYYANRGTEGSIRDVVADVANAEGYKDVQYKKAVDIAYEVNKALDSNVTFTGHSLGGGLAAAQALATNGRAITFNAASVNERTAEGLGINLTTSTAKIDAYYVKGEAVSWIQDSPGWDVANVVLTTPIKWGKGTVDAVRGLFGAETDPNFAVHGIAEANGTRIGMENSHKDSTNPVFGNDRHYTDFGFMGLDVAARATLHFNSSVQASMEHWIASARNVLSSSPSSAQAH